MMFSESHVKSLKEHVLCSLTIQLHMRRCEALCVKLPSLVGPEHSLHYYVKPHFLVLFGCRA